MSDLRDDDDTSAGRITQGGHAPPRGNSIWWVLALLIALVAAGVLWIGSHSPRAPAEQGTTPISGAGPSAGASATPSPATAAGQTAPGRP